MSGPPAIPSNPNAAQPVAPFLDVPHLLNASQPRARGAWFAPGIATLIVIVFVSAYFSSKSATYKSIVDAISALAMIGVVIAMGFVMWATVRRQQGERSRIDAIEELVQLRRWQQAAALLHQTLSQPTVSPNGRVQYLFFLASVLARYNRFDDAIAVQNHLMEEVDLDPSIVHALRLGRAMAMLREDHLFDADRAINELRRDVSRAVDPSQPEAEAPVSAGLSLIEIYRDVKTGHAAEAIEIFNRTQTPMRQQLGHRVADAHALVAKAHDFLGDSDRAQSHWERATVLSPPIELIRRYPELSSIADKYSAAVAPPEAQAAGEAVA
jgi:tetratricopeptide (TPR) repeat protein